jgi:translation initiation factor 4G
VYLRKLLPVAIIEEVIQFLIQDNAQTSFSDRVEVLVTLLSVVGPQIDWTRPVLVTCWDRIHELCAGEKTPPRVRFLLQDLMELRTSNWAPRRPIVESPKKLADVKKGRQTWQMVHTRPKASGACR